MVGLLLISATVIGVLTHATASDLAVDPTKAKYEEYKQNLQKLGECLERERTSSGHSVASANSKQEEQNARECPTGAALKWSLWPRPEISMCYRLKNQKLGEFGDEYTVADETSVGPERGAWFTAAKKHSMCLKNEHCEAGFEAKFQTKFDIVPRVQAHASVESYLTPHLATMILDLDVDATVTTGISVLAEGSCSYTETKYFPKMPKPVARFCHGPACAVVFFQGMMEINIEGRLEAGATAVHQVKFGAAGKIKLSTVTDTVTENNIVITTPRSAYRTKTYFDVHGKVSLKMGPVFTVMFTPGVGSLWASAKPWIQVEASMYGAMKETHEYYDEGMVISDALFEAHTVNEVQCLKSTTTTAPSTTAAPTTAATPTTTTAPTTAATSCFNAAIALRTGIEFDVGFVPKSLGSTKAEVKENIREYICKKPTPPPSSLRTASAPRSVFEEGFMSVIESPTAGGRRLAKAETPADVSQCVLGNTPAKKRRLGEGSASVASAIEWWCDNMVDWLFAALPEKSLYTLQHHSQTCKDFKLFPSNECSNKVGCNAEAAPGPVLIRAQDGEKVESGKAFVPELRSNGRYYPICGHYFWDDNHGAETICKRFGFTKGELRATKNKYNTDAMPVGRCNVGEPLDKCTAGGNAFGDSDYNEGWCKKGQSVGIEVVCTDDVPLVRARDYPSTPPAGEAFVPEAYYEGNYYPICGHHFWDDNHGAKTVCKSLGLAGGEVKITEDTYNTDAIPVGRCNVGERLNKCTAGGNAYGDFSKTYGWFGNNSCRKGQRIGVKVICAAYVQSLRGRK